MPDFSIIIPIYNAEKTLLRCLDSLKKQTDPDFEAILVENGSTDASNAICRKYAERDRRFRLITMETNCGPSGARNAGLERAGGTFVAFVDSDDFDEVYLFFPNTDLGKTISKTLQQRNQKKTKNCDVLYKGHRNLMEFVKELSSAEIPTCL